MKKYSASKLLVAFVIVSLLSLPSAFADKPDNPGKPEPKPEPSWSFYIPVDETLGLQGVNRIVDSPDTEEGGSAYAFESSNPATRNFITVYNPGKSSVNTYFNFEIMYTEEDPIPVIFNGVGAYSCPDEYVEGLCDEMFYQISSMEQPNGLPFNDSYGQSERIWFGFRSYSGFDYREQEIGNPKILNKGYFYIDSALAGQFEAYDNYITGSLLGDIWITRIDTNVWKISADLGCITAKMRGAIYGEVCHGKHCYTVVDETWVAAEGTADFNKTVTLYFVEEQPEP
jgi:hypothetical protein